MNGDLTHGELEHILLEEDARKLLDDITMRYDLSLRSIDNIKRVARTLADIHDINDSAYISPTYIKIAMNLRSGLPVDLK